jgi:hypothetical protein
VRPIDVREPIPDRQIEIEIHFVHQPDGGQSDPAIVGLEDCAHLHYDVAGRSLLTYKALCSYDVIGLVVQNTLLFVCSATNTDESV